MVYAKRSLDRPCPDLFGEYLSKEIGLTLQVVLLKANSGIVSSLSTSESLFF